MSFVVTFMCYRIIGWYQMIKQYIWHELLRHRKNKYVFVLANEYFNIVEVDLGKKVNELILALIKIFVTKSINYGLFAFSLYNHFQVTCVLSINILAILLSSSYNTRKRVKDWK